MNLNETNINISLFEDICRLCLKTFSSPHARFVIYGTSIENHSLEEILLKIFQIQVKQDDNLPQNLCTDCIFTLGQVYNFYELCQKSKQTLIEILEEAENKEKNNLLNQLNVSFQFEGTDNKQIYQQPIKRDARGQFLECIKCNVTFPSNYQYRKHTKIHNCKKKEVLEPSLSTGLQKETTEFSILKSPPNEFAKKEKDEGLNHSLNSDLVEDHNSTNANQEGSRALLLLCTKCNNIFANNQQYQNHKMMGKCMNKREMVQSSEETTNELEETSQLESLPYETIDEEKTEEIELKSRKKDKTQPKTLLQELYPRKRNEKGLLLECAKCHAVLPTHYQYQKHKRMHGLERRKKINKPKQAEEEEVEKENETNPSEERSLKRDHKDRPLECTECGSVFPSYYQLRKHKSTHDMPYQCPICNRKFEGLSWLSIHLETHGDGRLKRDSIGRLVQCEICHKICSSYHKYRVHKYEHTGGQKPFVCPHCGQDFLMYSRLKYHLYTHTNEKPISCPKCPKKFKNRVYLTYHVKNVHTEEPPTVVQCTKCDKVFDSVKKMRNHRAKHNVKPYLCSICGMYLARRAHWVMHMRSHSGEKPFKCQYCSKVFSRSFLLKYHLNIHTGDKPYQCKICGKAFSSPRRVQTHKKIHNRELHKCTYCEKEFLKKANLITHMKNHEIKIAKKMHHYAKDVCSNSEESNL